MRKALAAFKKVTTAELTGVKSKAGQQYDLTSKNSNPTIGRSCQKNPLKATFEKPSS